MTRESNCGHKNISWDAARRAYRLEARVAPGKSRTARFKTLAEALAKRGEWYAERDSLNAIERQKKEEEKKAAACSITKKDITITFD